MLITCIWSLSFEIHSEEAKDAQEAIMSIINKYNHFLQRSSDKERILMAFNQAIDKSSSSFGGSYARRALTDCKASYLSLFSNYRAY
ncbi:hypothetical protein KDK_47410 [Dictyobacter kobayashii]|uniref:Uncharacterized protein n=1 Tax=Dictyobacter kobayashii TaxID=2014872 RepID=A0A402AP17_9CHLR|nr:hypothetical protein KDK_47410 [Dictyobacter kobayashii]